MFNLQGSEIIVILLLALVVLGPEKLPDAIRRFSRTYAELKKMGSGFQTELKSALDEPMREMRETAEMVRDAADPDKIAAQAEAERADRTPDEGEPPIVAEPDEPPVGVADPGPTVADAEPPTAATTAAAAGAAAGAATAPDGTDDAEPADSAAASDTVADDADADSDGADDTESEDDAPARPVNRIAAGNSSAAITSAAAASAAAAEATSTNGSEPNGPAFHSAAPRHGRTDAAGDVDGTVADSGENGADDGASTDPGDEPTEAAIDESSGEAATA